MLCVSNMFMNFFSVSFILSVLYFAVLGCSHFFLRCLLLAVLILRCFRVGVHG